MNSVPTITLVFKPKNYKDLVRLLKIADKHFKEPGKTSWRKRTISKKCPLFNKATSFCEYLFDDYSHEGYNLLHSFSDENKAIYYFSTIKKVVYVNELNDEELE